MSVSVYSAIMAVIWFTAAAFIGSYTLRNASKYGLTVVAAILCLSVLRIFLPLDLDHSIVIRSVRVYPFLQDLVRTALIGDCTVGVCLLICWAAGACVFLSRLASRLRGQRDFRRSGLDIPVPLDLLREVSGDLGYSGPAALVFSPRASSAYQLGFFRPFIILPCTAMTYREEELRNMLRHEMCHFLSGDLWYKTGLQALSCVLWWNPAMLLLGRNAEQTMELRCDQRVCWNLEDIERVEYLETMMHLIHDSLAEPTGISMGYLGCTDDANLKQRFEMVLAGKARTASKITTIVGCLLCAFLFVSSYFVIIQPWTTPINTFGERGSVETESLDGSYIICGQDGTLRFYCDGLYCFNLFPSDLNNDPFNGLQIIYEGVQKK